MNHESPVLPPALRSWIYSVLTPVGALVAFYGIASDEEVALWIGLAFSVIHGGTAIAYRPTKSAIPTDNPEAVDAGEIGVTELLVVVLLVLLILFIANRI
jgi:hypothetical protein